MKIMIIEDHDIIRHELSTLLTRYGYDIVAPTQFETIIETALSQKPHLILLDINLPIFDGFYICKQLREQSDIPIIIVTSRATELDELMSMNLGADDFITKPYNTQILLARIHAILNRTYKLAAQSDKLTYKDLTVDLTKGIATAFKQEIELSKNELKIISYLIKHKEKIVSRDDLMTHMWNSDVFVDDNTLSVNVNRLRKQLERIGITNYIETRRGLGYILK